VCGGKKSVSHSLVVENFAVGILGSKYVALETLLDYTTNIQSQLFSVGFVVSGLSACHVGCLTGLPVLTA
jgi:hypothetical protein